MSYARTCEQLEGGGSVLLCPKAPFLRAGVTSGVQLDPDYHKLHVLLPFILRPFEFKLDLSGYMNAHEGANL